MARFYQARTAEYVPRFTPTTIGLIAGQLESKQKSLDATLLALESAEFPVKANPWDLEGAKAEAKILSDKTTSLAEELAKSGDVRQIAPKLSQLKKEVKQAYDPMKGGKLGIYGANYDNFQNFKKDLDEQLDTFNKTGKDGITLGMYDSAIKSYSRKLQSNPGKILGPNQIAGYKDITGDATDLAFKMPAWTDDKIGEWFKQQGMEEAWQAINVTKKEKSPTRTFPLIFQALMNDTKYDDFIKQDIGWNLEKLEAQGVDIKEVIPKIDRDVAQNVSRFMDIYSPEAADQMAKLQYSKNYKNQLIEQAALNAANLAAFEEINRQRQTLSASEKGTKGTGFPGGYPELGAEAKVSYESPVSLDKLKNASTETKLMESGKVAGRSAAKLLSSEELTLEARQFAEDLRKNGITITLSQSHEIDKVFDSLNREAKQFNDLKKATRKLDKSEQLVFYNLAATMPGKTPTETINNVSSYLSKLEETQTSRSGYYAYTKPEEINARNTYNQNNILTKYFFNPETQEFISGEEMLTRLSKSGAKITDIKTLGVVDPGNYYVDLLKNNIGTDEFSNLFATAEEARIGSDSWIISESAAAYNTSIKPQFNYLINRITMAKRAKVPINILDFDSPGIITDILSTYDENSNTYTLEFKDNKGKTLKSSPTTNPDILASDIFNILHPELFK